MHIEEIIIDGFKSYSTRVPVGRFDRQFNAITGMSSSRKSCIIYEIENVYNKEYDINDYIADTM